MGVKKGEQMPRCSICEAESGHFIGCVKRLQEIDRQPRLGYRPIPTTVVLDRDPIMNQGGPFPEDELSSRPTLDPDEYE
ncbi:MAG: hypothetical protein V1695_02760 [Candidatus Uhrbacteria bacterium]